VINVVLHYNTNKWYGKGWFRLEKPVIGITMGDPAGVGPEIILKAFRNSKLHTICNPLVIGSTDILKNTEEFVRTGLFFRAVCSPEEAEYEPGIINILPVDNIDADSIRWGQIQSKAGRAAYGYIEAAVQLAKKGSIKAVATAPINKESIKAAKIDFIGHTEMLAGLTDTDDPLTMFQVHNLRVFFLSRHVSLRKACELVNIDRLSAYIARCDSALNILGLERRKIAVAGLNPHSGEHGLFGDEEVLQIEPAIKLCRARGIDVDGPIAADSVFFQALNGKFDAVLSLYHDQGHIATKMVDFEKTISLTIGLPFLRTSVDHGTAFDIAGKGIASSVSMEEAIILAAQYSENYNKANL
jgi:4-hydroxythreonine-4-phosphate dehydrogenase